MLDRMVWYLGLIVVLVVVKSSDGFTTPVPPFSVTSLDVFSSRACHTKQSPLLYMASDESQSKSTKKRRKRRRTTPESMDVEKQLDSEASVADVSSSGEEAAPVEEVPVLKPRDDSPVEIKVQSVVKKAASESVPSTSAVQTTTSSPVSSTSQQPGEGSINDSLEMLLADARRMKEEEGGVEENVDDGGVKAKIRNALSTVVTVDFFIVCGFLLWFLLGIFCSSVLKDDTVQIAFNSNFQAFVQPSLGILMIAAIAGNFFKEEEEEQF